jgi:hypothetical protein
MPTILCGVLTTTCEGSIVFDLKKKIPNHRKVKIKPSSRKQN